MTKIRGLEFEGRGWMSVEDKGDNGVAPQHPFTPLYLSFSPPPLLVLNTHTVFLRAFVTYAVDE